MPEKCDQRNDKPDLGGNGQQRKFRLHRAAHGASFDMTMVPEAANMPPTPWQTEILAPGIWAEAVPRIWHTLSCNVYMPECM